MHLVKSCLIRTGPHWPALARTVPLVHFNVITPLDHIIVSDVVSHFLVNSAEVLCNQAAFALKSNPPTTIQQSTEMSLFGFWPFKHGVLFLLKQKAFLFIAALMQLNACRHVFFFMLKQLDCSIQTC